MAQHMHASRRRPPRKTQQLEQAGLAESAGRPFAAPANEVPPPTAGHDFASIAPDRANLHITPSADSAEQQADQVAAAALHEPATPGTIGELAAPDAAASSPAPEGFAAEVAAARSRGRPLEATGRAPLEGLLGADFSAVRIHADRHADRMSRSIGADAFTSGRDIFFRQGAYQPTRPEGRSFLAHELTHVVQQGNRQISPFVQRGIFGKFKQAWKNRQDSGEAASVEEEDRAASREKIQEIEEKYGVKLDNLESLKPQFSWKDKLLKQNSEYESYRKQKKLSKEWTNAELQNIEEVLERFAPLLSEDRPEEWGSQPLLHLGRFNFSIQPHWQQQEGRGVTDIHNPKVSMYDPAYNNPEFQERDQRFRGVLTREVARAFLSSISPNSESEVMVEFRGMMPFWQGRVWHPEYWRTKDGRPVTYMYADVDENATRQAAADNNVEAPLTLSGMENSYTDLAEAVMFFFEDPARLQREGPERFQFVQEHVTPYLNEETVPEAAGVTTE